MQNLKCYAIWNEYAASAINAFTQHTRLSFLNAQAALDALAHVMEIMAGEFQWSYLERQ